jgi:hypothetical protein
VLWLLGKNLMLVGELTSAKSALEKEKERQRKLLQKKDNEISSYVKLVEELETKLAFKEHEKKYKQSMRNNSICSLTVNGFTQRTLPAHSMSDSESGDDSFCRAQRRKSANSTSGRMFDTSEEDIEEVEEIVANTQPSAIHSLPPEESNCELFREQNSEIQSISDLQLCVPSSQSIRLDDSNEINTNYRARSSSNYLFDHTKTASETNISTMIPDSLQTRKSVSKNTSVDKATVPEFPFKSPYVKLPFKSFSQYKPIRTNLTAQSKPLAKLLERCFDLPSFFSVFAQIEHDLLSKHQITFLFDQFKADSITTQLTLDALRSTTKYEVLICDWLQICICSSDELRQSEEPSLINYIIIFLKELKRKTISQVIWLKFYHSLFAFLNVYFARIDLLSFHGSCNCAEWLATAFGDFFVDLCDRFEDTILQENLIRQVLAFVIQLNRTPIFKKSDVLSAKMHYFSLQVNQFWSHMAEIKILNINSSDDNRSRSNP